MGDHLNSTSDRVSWEVASPIVGGVKIEVLKKRKRAPSPIAGLKKKCKMNEEDSKAIISSSLAEQSEAFGKMLEKNTQSMQQAFKEHITPIHNELAALNSKTEQQDRIVAELSANLSELKQTIKEEIKQECKEEFAAAREVAYKYALSIEVDKANRNLIIFGLKSDKDLNEQVTEVIASLSLPVDIKCEIKRCHALGKGANPPTLVELGNEFHRNEILRHSSKAPKGITFDRDVPKAYRSKYKDFKRIAWKYRSFYKVSTQIVFEGHTMQLRYKELGKAYTIVKSYYPPPPAATTSAEVVGFGKNPANPSLMINSQSLQEMESCFLIKNTDKIKH